MDKPNPRIYHPAKRPNGFEKSSFLINRETNQCIDHGNGSQHIEEIEITHS